MLQKSKNEKLLAVMDCCSTERVTSPLLSVQSWGVLSNHDQNHMSSSLSNHSIRDSIDANQENKHGKEKNEICMIESPINVNKRLLSPNQKIDLSDEVGVFVSQAATSRQYYPHGTTPNPINKSRVFPLLFTQTESLGVLGSKISTEKKPLMSRKSNNHRTKSNCISPIITSKSKRILKF